MATVEVVSAKNVLLEDTTEASLKTDQKKFTQEVVETPIPAASEQTKEEEAAVIKAPEHAAPEGKPSDEVETKDVVEEEAKVEIVTITEEAIVEKKEEETKREEAETEVVEETKESADPAAEPETGIQKEDVVKEEKEAKDKDNKEAPAEQSEEKVDTEASDEKKEEEVIAGEKSEEVIDGPSEKSE